MSLLFSKTGRHVQFIASFVTAPFHSYYRMSLYRLGGPLHFKHIGVNVRLRLTDIQSIRYVSTLPEAHDQIFVKPIYSIPHSFSPLGR